MENPRKPKISVHVIAKETTNYGRMIFEAALKSLLIGNKGYADQVILLDNGCSHEVRDMYFPMMDILDPACSLIIDQRNLPTFADKRNACLEQTDKDTDYIHWIDTDDIHHTGILNHFKEDFLSNPEKVKDLSTGVCSFYHAMGCPWMIEGYYPKDNFFRYNPNLRWGKAVHEKLENLSPGSQMVVPFFYYHVGYTRSAISTACKWVHYSMLEDGKPDLYLRPDQRMYSLGIDRTIDDRLSSCKRVLPTERIIPDAFMPILYDFTVRYGDMASKTPEEAYDLWQRYTIQVDPGIGAYLRQWTPQALKDGHWGACIRDIAEKKLWEIF